MRLLNITCLAWGLALAAAAYSQPSSAPAARPSIAPDANAFVVNFKVKPGKNADFEKAMGEVLAGVRQHEPRNVYSDLLRLAKDPQGYAIVERYADADAGAAQAHADSAYIKKVGELFQHDDLLEGPPETQELVFIRSK